MLHLLSHLVYWSCSDRFDRLSARRYKHLLVQRILSVRHFDAFASMRVSGLVLSCLAGSAIIAVSQRCHTYMQASHDIAAGVGVTPTFAGYKSRHLREELVPMRSSAQLHSRRLQDVPTGCQVAL